jgi:hypothetical protein
MVDICSDILCVLVFLIPLIVCLVDGMETEVVSLGNTKQRT